MPALHNDFADFLRLLNERNVRYLVVGGYAVACPGRPHRPPGSPLTIRT